MEILRVLWERGPSSVREVHEVLGDRKGTGLSTTLKMMQVMTGKGLLMRDPRDRPQIYSPTRSEEEIQRGVVLHVLDRVFGGSLSGMLTRALESEQVGEEEIIRTMEVLNESQRRLKKDKPIIAGREAVDD
jgi:predicted transcriptional regulator